MAINLLLLSLLVFAVSALDYVDNVFVVLSSSKFYFNYRHSLNAFQFYAYLK